MREGMARLERGNDALDAGQPLESGKGLGIGRGGVDRPADVLEPRVLRPDPGVVEPRGHRVGALDLSVRVLHEVGSIAVQDPGTPGAERRGVPARREAVSGRFDPVQLDVRVVEKGVEQPDRVGASADARDDRVGQPPGPLEDLLARLAPDHRVEVAHHLRIRMGPGDGADDVVGIVDVRHPVAHGLVERILQGLRARGDGADLRAEKAHPVDVGRLAVDVLLAHVHDALEAEARRDGCGRDPVLAGPGLGDDPGLAHASGEQGLSHGVVHLVRAGMVEVLALEPDLRSAHRFAQPPGVVEGGRTPDEVAQLGAKFGVERRVRAEAFIGGGELFDRPHQRLRDEASAERPEAPLRVRPGPDETGWAVNQTGLFRHLRPSPQRPRASPRP